MPRRRREATGGLVYHVLNRAVRRTRLFDDDADHAAFERVVEEACERLPTRILCYCLMPNHWHLVLWPRRDGELSEFMRWPTVTHTQRWHAHRHSAGTGPVYQGRFLLTRGAANAASPARTGLAARQGFKSFPVQEDVHLLTVCRYVERNALRADLVQRAEQWPWSSLCKRSLPPASRPAWLPALSAWPVRPPRDWTACVNRAQTGQETEAIRHSIRRGTPLGEQSWQRRTAAKLGLESTRRPIGRPRKSKHEAR